LGTGFHSSEETSASSSSPKSTPKSHPKSHSAGSHGGVVESSAKRQPRWVRLDKVSTNMLRWKELYLQLSGWEGVKMFSS